MIGDRLKALRKQENFSVKKLSELSTVPVATIDKIESNQTQNPTFQTVVNLCTALGVTVDALLYPEAGKKESFVHPSQHPLSDRMIDQYERLLAEQKEKYDLIISEKDKQLHDKDLRIEEKNEALRYRGKWLTVLCALLCVVILFSIAWLVLDLIVPAFGWFR